MTCGPKLQGELNYAVFRVKWGFSGILANNRSLIRTTLPMQNSQLVKKYLLVGIRATATHNKDLFGDLQKWIISYFEGCYVDFNQLALPPILLHCSDFSKKILKTCKKIRFGETITYAELARRAGADKAARATGAVLAANPLPLIIPCHRVIRSDGGIGGFSADGGVDLKERLLRHERLIGTG